MSVLTTVENVLLVVLAVLGVAVVVTGVMMLKADAYYRRCGEKGRCGRDEGC